MLYTYTVLSSEICMLSHVAAGWSTCRSSRGTQKLLGAPLLQGGFWHKRAFAGGAYASKIH